MPVQPNGLLTSIEDSLAHQPDAPKATSRDLNWPGVTIDTFGRADKLCLEAPARDHHIVLVVTTGTARVEQQRAGVIHSGTVTAGNVLIVPSGYESRWYGAAPPTAKIRFPTTLLTSAADQIGIRHETELRNVFDARDPFIEHISSVLTAELARTVHPAQALIAEASSLALAAHLLRSYDGLCTELQSGPRTLAPRVLGRIHEYIQDALDEKITLDELATIAGVSRFHFSRLFKQSTGLSPIAYVERSRMDRAQSLIRSGTHSLVEIALIVGFADQSHFSRRFRRHMRCTPTQFARDHAVRDLPQSDS
jgi:AraC family transcriptional regulator